MTREEFRIRPNQKSLSEAAHARREPQKPGRTVFVPRTDFVSPKRIAEGISAELDGISEGVVAQAADCTKDTAQSYKLGRRAPSAAKLINLARNIPAVRAWLYREIEQSEGFESPQLLTAFIGALHKLSEMPGPEGDAVRKAMRGEEID